MIDRYSGENTWEVMLCLLKVKEYTSGLAGI